MSTETENTPTEAEALAELSKSEDATLYIDQRHEDENVDRIESEAEATVRDLQEKLPELKEAKKASRYTRLKAARDQYKAEADELRQKYEPQGSERESYSETDENTGLNPNANEVQLERSLAAAQHLHGDSFQKAYEAFVDHCARTQDQAAYQRVMQSSDQGAELLQWWNEAGNPSASPEAVEAAMQQAMQQGRQEQEFQQQLAERDAQIRTQAELDLRIEAFTRHVPDFHEVIASVDGLDEVPTVMLDLIKRSPFAPEIVYTMAQDVWAANSHGLFEHARSLQNDPVAQAKMVGQMEQAIMSGRNQGTWPGGPAQPARATKAPPPLSPVRGGASAPKDLHSLAKSDSADDYIRARRSAP